LNSSSSSALKRSSASKKATTSKRRGSLGETAHASAHSSGGEAGITLKSALKSDYQTKFEARRKSSSSNLRRKSLGSLNIEEQEDDGTTRKSWTRRKPIVSIAEHFQLVARLDYATV
jgi:hypothetical protein